MYMYQAWDLDMNKPKRSLPGQETVLISGFILEGNHRMMNICSMWITFHNFYHAVLLVILNIYYLQTIWFISGLTKNFIFKPYLVKRDFKVEIVFLIIVSFLLQVSEDEKAYIQVFEKFREALKDVITRNKNKRIKIHIK